MIGKQIETGAGTTNVVRTRLLVLVLRAVEVDVLFLLVVREGFRVDQSEDGTGILLVLVTGSGTLDLGENVFAGFNLGYTLAEGSLDGSVIRGVAWLNVGGDALGQIFWKG